jgi:translation initiation factor IF-1
MDVLPSGVCRVELPNGHRILAHRSRKMRTQAVGIGPADRVVVEMSPFDMSKGCITNRK